MRCVSRFSFLAPFLRAMHESLSLLSFNQRSGKETNTPCSLTAFGSAAPAAHGENFCVTKDDFNLWLQTQHVNRCCHRLPLGCQLTQFKCGAMSWCGIASRSSFCLVMVPVAAAFFASFFFWFRRRSDVCALLIHVEDRRPAPWRRGLICYVLLPCRGGQLRSESTQRQAMRWGLKSKGAPSGQQTDVRRGWLPRPLRLSA